MPYMCEILPTGPLNLTQAYCSYMEDGGKKITITRKNIDLMVLNWNFIF